MVIKTKILTPLSATLVLYLVLTVIPACTSETGPGSPADSAESPPAVYTTFYPAAYFTRRIAGDAIDVVLPLPAGVDPASWKPTRETILSYQQADLVIANGAGFEKWLGQASLPVSRLVMSARILTDELLQYQDIATHSHGPQGEHAHQGVDGHTWLDPLNAIRQASVIRDELSNRYPALSAHFHDQYRELEGDLRSYDNDLRVMSQTTASTPVLASHPAFNYLARRYHWNLKNLNLDPEVLPDKDVLADIHMVMQSHPARFIIWESAPDEGVAAVLLNQLGLRSVVFSPAELPSVEQLSLTGDYLAIMKANLLNIQPVFNP